MMRGQPLQSKRGTRKKMNHQLNNKLLRYEQEADAITSKPMDGTSRARLQFLLAAISTVKREFGAVSDRAVSSDQMEFRKVFLSDLARRTYVPLSESGNGQTLIPSAFELTLKNMMLSDGPFFAGSPLLTNFYAEKMLPAKIAVADDLGSTGFVLTENSGSATSEAELVGISGVTIGSSSKNYSTGLLLASTQLVDDVTSFASMEQVIQTAASQRLSRIQNATFLSALKTSLAANSSSAVAAGGSAITAANVYSLASAVGSAYRRNAVFVMSPAQQTAIGALTATGSGLREFPNVLDAEPSILGYAVHTIAAASTNDCLFGDFSFLFTKSTPVRLQVLRERFVDQGFYGYILQERADAKWSVATTSDSPVKYLVFS
jgi:HK97 family phage major capsid protein